jgi:hypothetical protein
VTSGGELNDVNLSSVGGGEQQEILGQNQETDLFSRILEMMEEERKNKKEILDRLDILNEKFNEKLELETIQRSQDIPSLKEQTQQSIQVVNGKLNGLSSSMCESVELCCGGIRLMCSTF